MHAIRSLVSCKGVLAEQSNASSARYDADTILPKPETDGSRAEIGQRLHLSPGDVVQANKLYKCLRK